MSPQAHVVTRNKDAGLPGNGGEFAATTRQEPSLDDFRLAASVAQDEYMKALEVSLAISVHEDFPDVATLEFDAIEHDESMPWLVNAKTADGTPVDEDVLDAIRNEHLSGFDERDFGEWVSEDTIDLDDPKRPRAHAINPNEGADIPS